MTNQRALKVQRGSEKGIKHPISQSAFREYDFEVIFRQKALCDTCFGGEPFSVGM